MMQAGGAAEFTWEGRKASVLRWCSRVTAMRSRSRGARSTGDPKHPGLAGCSGLESLAASRQVDLI